MGRRPTVRSDTAALSHCPPSNLAAVHCYLMRQKAKPSLQASGAERRAGVSVTESVQSHTAATMAAFNWNSSLLLVLAGWYNV